MKPEALKTLFRRRLRNSGSSIRGFGPIGPGSEADTHSCFDDWKVYGKAIAIGSRVSKLARAVIYLFRISFPLRVVRNRYVCPSYSISTSVPARLRSA